MSRKGGKLVQWTDDKGLIRKGYAPYKAQKKAFQDVKKAFLIHHDDEGNDLKDENNKVVCSLVSWDRLIITGYVD